MRAIAVALTLAAAGHVAFAQPGDPAPPGEGSAAGSGSAEAPPATEQPPPSSPAAAPPPVTPVRAEPPPPAPPGDTVKPGPEKGLRFGSYGRMIAGSDLRGGKPVSANIVGRGPRIVEPSYLEIDVSYGLVTKRGLALRPVITLAFRGTLFHDTGQFDAQPALRNVFLDAQVTSELTAWAGSRMYRGDDIYLFDTWPLDDLNTVGGGLFYRKAVGAPATGNALELAGHAGVNRLLTPFQFQEIDVPNPEQGATTVVQLNRQRMVASANAAYIFALRPDAVSLKAKVHAELHTLPSGTRKRTDGTFEQLPSDSGFLLGGQLSAFAVSKDKPNRSHLNLYLRYAKGLAAFDELAPPTSFGNDLTTDRASELSFGLSGNYDHAFGNVMLGALSRRFIDADGDSIDHDDGWEYAVAVRPLARLPLDFFAGAELSYQARFPRGLNPTTQRAEDPAVFQIAPMLVYSPMGGSGYDRPQLRLVYRGARRNQAALDEYVPDDPRHLHTWTHFLGIQAEWWFNSNTYR